MTGRDRLAQTLLRVIDRGAARTYHEGTKHSPLSVMTDQHRLDWANRPLPYKVYETLIPIPLPLPLEDSDVPALKAITGAAPFEGRRIPDLPELGHLCHYSNGVLRRRRLPGGDYGFRAAPCTGALYHIELYLAVGALPGLGAGLYHFGAHEGALRQLRSGDVRGVLVEACGGEPSMAGAPVIAALTSTFWRNAWKYRGRAYRHSYWDSGVILANLLAVAAALRLPARVVLGFEDGAVNHLLGCDVDREAAVCLVALGSGLQPAAGPVLPELRALDLPTRRLSNREVDYQEIRAAHSATSLRSGEEAAAWRAAAAALSSLEPPVGPVVPLQPLAAAELPREPIEAVIRRRRSARRFSRAAIGFPELSTVLASAASAPPFDCVPPDSAPADVFLIASAVGGLEPGAYAFHPREGALELLRAGQFRRRAGYLALGQELAEEAAVNAYFLSPLDHVLERMGERGYRVAQLAAALAGGRLELAAQALNLSATGLTFFDDEVTNFFSPRAAESAVMYLAAVGILRRSQ